MNNKTLLFCIPYAGGSAASMSNVANSLSSENLKVHCVELPGRGMRSQEPFHSKLDEAVEDISEQINKTLHSKNQTFILWGHSMGAILALLLSFNMHKTYKLKGLIVSGMQAPSFKSTDAPLSRKKLNELLLDILPTKYESSKNSPLFQRVQQKRIQIMEKDISLLETSQNINWLSIIIGVPLKVIMVKDDELYKNKDCYKQWSYHTSNVTNYFFVEGGHFFMFQYPKQTTALLSRIINDLKTINS